MTCLRKLPVYASLALMTVLAVAPMAGAQTAQKKYAKILKGTNAKVFKIDSPTRSSPENDMLYRVQVRVKTANRKDAGTDDPVKVRINGAEGTWIDSAVDDHERGRSYLYDLVLLNAGSQGLKIRDITQLEISKTGSNGWCIESLELIVNNRVIYQKTFTGGQWLDNSKGKQPKFVISSRSLRANAKWKAYKSPLPSGVIKRTELEQRIESIIGHYIHADKKVQWGKLSGRGVEVTQKDNQTIHVDLDLKGVVKYFPDAAIDVDFDIQITTRKGAIDLQILNFTPRITSRPHKALLAVNGFFGGTNKSQLQRSIRNEIQRNLASVALSIPTGDRELVALVNHSGDLVLLLKS